MATNGTKRLSGGRSPFNISRNRRGRSKTPRIHESLYKFVCTAKEEHGMQIYGVQFNPYYDDTYLFATVGKNLVSVYECVAPSEPSMGLTFDYCFSDPDPEEIFYTCAWSYNPETEHPLLAAAGARGVIRILCLESHQSIKHFIGHGQAINELKFHPTNPKLLLSGSKDHSIRLWNIATDVCVAIFGGVEAHRDEVISVDFNFDGSRIMSGGMDHSLKMWRLDKPGIREALEESSTFRVDQATTQFNTIKEHFPDFSTRDIHRNYVDCVMWFNDILFSKSCEANSIVCWMPEYNNLRPQDSVATVLFNIPYDDCEIWFVRFGFNSHRKTLAMGTKNGKTYVWQLTPDGKPPKQHLLVHPKCNATIRQTTFSNDGTKLICVCDDSTIWRWDLNVKDDDGECGDAF